jgi:hypothetical protein
VLTKMCLDLPCQRRDLGVEGADHRTAARTVAA